MAIAYASAGAGGGTETSGAQLALACPATVNAGDILIAHVTWLNNTTEPTDPSGWTRLYPPSGLGAALGTGTPTGRSYVYGKIADGTEDGATVNFGTAGGTAGRFGRIYRFTGRVSGTITELVRSFADTPSETDPSSPGIATSITGALAVALIAQDDNNAIASFTGESGGDFTEALAEYTSTSIGAQGCMCQLQTGVPTSDPGRITGGTYNTTDDECSTIVFEIRPEVPTGINYQGGYGQDDGSNGETGGAITSDVSTFNFDAQAGDKIVIYIWVGDENVDDTASITVTDSAGNTYTKVPGSSDAEGTFGAAGATGSCHCLFECDVTSAITGNSTTLTITLPDSSLYVRYIVRCYREMDGGSLVISDLAVDTDNQTVGAGDPWVGGTVDVAVGDYMVGCVQSIPGSVTWSLGTGMSSLTNTTTAGMAGGAHKKITSGGTDAPTMNSSVADEGYGISYVVSTVAAQPRNVNHVHRMSSFAAHAAAVR